MTDVRACDCVYMCVNFEDKILLSGEECENLGKFEFFLQNDQLLLWYRLQTWKYL